MATANVQVECLTSICRIVSLEVFLSSNWSSNCKYMIPSTRWMRCNAIISGTMWTYSTDLDVYITFPYHPPCLQSICWDMLIGWWTCKSTIVAGDTGTCRCSVWTIQSKPPLRTILLERIELAWLTAIWPTLCCPIAALLDDDYSPSIRPFQSWPNVGSHITVFFHSYIRTFFCQSAVHLILVSSVQCTGWHMCKFIHSR